MTSSSAKSVETLEAEAAAWAAKLDAAPDQAHPDLDAWFAQDPKHAGALLRAQAALALFEPPAAVDVQPVEASAGARRRRLPFMGGGAAVIAASLAAAVLIHAPAETYETQIGEIRSMALSDGSSVSIDARSRIDVAFDPLKRDVHLQAGKVLFRATHNAARPFRVLVGDIVITDIGTAFQVTDLDRSGEVEVLVTEGAVRVDGPAGRLDLVAGQKARFSKAASGGAQPQPVRVASADIDRTLAWRDGRLELNGETLDSAVAEINRHSRLQIRVAGTALQKESLYGSFRMDDATGFAQAVAASLGTSARVEPEGIVIAATKK